MKQWKLIVVTLLAVLMVCVCTSAMAEVCDDGCPNDRSKTTAGTCTTAGSIIVYECNIPTCDNYKVESYTIPLDKDPENHADLTWIAGVDATCTTTGTAGHYKCACGALLNSSKQVVSAADLVKPITHSWKVTETVAATCTKDGYKVSVCKLEGCTETKTETLTMTGHALKFVEKVDPDCGNEGYDLYECQNKDCTYSEKLHAVPAVGEHDWDKKNIVPPTCTTEGYSSYTCTVCGEKKKDDFVEANGHDFSVFVDIVTPYTCQAKGTAKYACSAEKCDATKNIKYTQGADAFHADKANLEYIEALPATCTEPGHTNGWKCTVCDWTKDYSELPVDTKTGHSFTKYVEAKAPTCVEAGYSNHWVCTLCGEKKDYKVVEDKDAHDTVNVPKQWQTCTEDGRDAYTYCKLCDKVWGGAVIKAPGHAWENWSIKKEATCTETGILHQGCKWCDAEQDVDIPMVAHVWYEEPNKVIEATCTVDGYAWYVCKNCDEANKEETIPATGHTMRYMDNFVADCENDGYDWWKCINSGCDYEEQRNVVTALGHDWTLYQNHPATCLKGGYDRMICKTCGEKENQNPVDALGHDWKANKVYEPTCTSKGWTSYVCDREGCDEKKKDDYVDMLPHDYSHPSCLVLNILPTCTEEGYQKYECINCGEPKEVEVEMLPHNYAEANWKTSVPATCVETGMDINNCTICGAEPKYKETPALGHKLGNVIEKTAATCTEAGEGIQHCVRVNKGDKACDYEITVTIPAKGHDLKETEVVPATCTGNGLKKITCKNKCGISKYELIPAFGHQNLEEVSKTPATCTEAGEIVNKCKDCGTTVPEVIPATGHQHTKEEIVKAPTCTEAGSNQVVCTDCNTVIETKEVAAKGHGATKEVADKAATCTAAGSINVICTVCGDVLETKEVAALGHGATKEEAVKAATCTEAGSVNVICTVCGETLETKEVAALGHELDEGVVTAPTCTEDGYTTYACTRCDYTEVKDETKATGHVDTKEVETLAPTCTEAGNIDVICACGEVVESKAVEALGHDMVAGEVTAPTCTEKGYTTYECSRCDATEIKDETEALGHTYEWVMDAVVASPAAPGENWYQCSVCEDIADIEYVKYTKYYYENTLTSFGPTTEELLGEGDWYRVTPIDLSVDGIYNFDLIASNAYVVGTVTITVSEGVMTVSYDVNANHIEVLEEALVLYASKADLAEGKGVTVAFGEEINLAETFGEDSKVLVSLMLIGTYDAAGYGVYGFEADAEEIADLLAIVD